MKLPEVDELFQKFCAPWYDDVARKHRGIEGPLPVMVVVFKPGTPVEQVHSLTGKQREFIVRAVDRMLQAAEADWKKSLAIEGEPSLQWVDEFDKYYGRSEVQSVIDVSDPASDANDYFILCVELGVVLGTIFRQLLPRLEWVPEWPYWESALYDAETGTIINPFTWAVERMSEYGVDDGLSARVQVAALLLQGKHGDTKWPPSTLDSPDSR